MNRLRDWLDGPNTVTRRTAIISGLITGGIDGLANYRQNQRMLALELRIAKLERRGNL